MRKRKVQDGELHEIENKRRSRVVRDKKKGEKRLKPWTKKRKLRALLPVCLIAIFAVAIFALGSFGNVDSNKVDDGFVTVSYPLPTDASTPLDHSALENIGYMNTRFKGQESWYSEMHGTTVAAGVNQSVNTFKQYSNNALIMADITSSSLVNAARQFCYYGDEVMWRNGTSYTGGSFEEMNAISWKTGEPYAHMTVSDFKARNGLPGTELFVYVINEATLVSATEVVDNGDGTYTQSYVLDPATDKAPAHYVNQMKFTGGLTGLPEFNHINLTCTFDDTWQILSIDVDEGYKAEMVITVNCTSSFHTDFSYNTPKAESSAFEDYFKQYVGKGITNGELPAAVDAMGCLTSAFLSKPVSLELSCVLNGNEVEGLVYLDASKLDIAAIMRGGQVNLDAALAGIELRAQIGEISLYLDKGTAYISAGSLKAKLGVEELIELIDRYTAPSEDTPTAGGNGAPIFAIDDPATEEPDDGFSYVAGESALMKAKLDLSSLGIDLSIPLNFNFSLDEGNRATLARADLSLVYDGVAVSVQLDNSEKEVAPLSEAAKSEFIDLIPYADGLAELFTQETLKAEIDYRAESFSVSGSVDLAIKEGLRASGELLLTVGEAQLPVKFGFEDSVLYINVAGMKVRAGVDEITALVKKLTSDGSVSAESEMGLAKLIDLVLKNDLLALLDVREDEGALNIAVKGTELLKIFGIDFALGNVEVSVADGVLSASVLGANVKVTKGESVTVDKEGYIAILPYAEELIKLFTSEAIALNINYNQNGLKVAGDLTVNLKEFAVAGSVTLGYQEIEKSVELYFADNTVYLAIDGLKVKASIQTILDLVAEITGESIKMPEIDIESLLGKVLSLDFAKLLQMREENGKLCLTVDGTELLNALGLAFELGDITLEVGKGEVNAAVFGATVAITAGTAKTVTGLEEYADIAPLIPYVGELNELFTSPVLKAEINYVSEKFSVNGEVSIAIQGEIKLSGEVNITYGEASIAAKLGYEDGTVYLDAAGMKLKVSTDEISALLKDLLPESGSLDVQTLLDTLLSEETLQNFTITEGDGILSIAVKGTELLKIFGIDFALGNVEVSVSDGALSASVLGANVKVTKGEAVTVDKDGYIAILPYAEELIELFTSEAIALNVNYEQDGLKLAGDLTVNLKEFAVAGSVTLGYQNIEKSVELYFADNTVYLAIDGLKVKASVQTILDLVAEITGERVEMPEIDIESLLGKVLSLDFAKLLQMREENGKLCLTVDGTELLSALGLAFELGDISVEVGKGEVNATVFGATVAITAGTAKTVTGLEEYADIAPLIPYVGELKDLFTSPVLKAEIDYASEKFSVSGEVSIALQGEIKLSGEVNITYGEASIAAKLGYENGVVYVDVAGMKLKVSTDEIAKLLQQETPENGESGFDLQELLDTLLSEETLQNFTITEGDGILSIAVKGTELLQILGIDFALGNVDLSVTDGVLSASVLGANVKVTKGESVTVEKEGYIEILPYIEDIIKLFTGEAVSLSINYEQNGLKVAGDLTVKMGNYHIYGTVKLAYNGFEKLASVYFDGVRFYLAVDGLKVRVDTEDIKGLVQELMGNNTVDLGAVATKLLTTDISKLIALSKTENKLELLVHGSELLRELGINFALGDLNLTVENGKLHLGVLGISLNAEAGVAFTSEEVWSDLGSRAEFADVGGLLKRIPQILSDKAISLNGSVALNLGDTKITVGVEQGVLSWKNGLNVYLDLRLNVNGTVQRIELAVDTTKLRLAYGQIGVELAFSELGDLESALMKLYREVRETADKFLVSQNPMPEQVDGLLDLLEAITSATNITIPDFKNFKIETLLSELVIGAPKSKDGICTVEWKGVSLELLNTNAKRLAGVLVQYQDKNVSVSGTLSADCYAGELPVLPELDYLDKAAFENLIDYLGAAVATLAETNLQVSLSGEVLSTDTQKYPDGKKYEIKGEINYYAGSSTAIRLDLDGKKLWVNTDVYLYVSFALVAKAEGDQGLEMQLFLLDSDGDGVLDVYASVSLLGRDSAAYAPLNLYARADELMPVLAEALALLGVDNSVVTDYVLAPWLDATTTSQLKGLGDGLKTMILGLIGGKSEEKASRQAEEVRSFISSVKIGEDTFTVSLPSDVLFGVEGDDLTVTIGKVNGENGARLSFVSVANIYGNDGVENTSLHVGIQTKSDAEKPQPAFDDLMRIEGVSSLLKTLAKSTTHEEVISGEAEKHSYKLNQNFYIEGDIAIDLNVIGIIKLNVNIRLVAISVTIDENNDVGVNVRFEYDGIEELGIAVINGSSTIDLTGKNGMVYIKRVQTTDASKKPLAQPVTVYRSMPLNNFVSDILAQMGFVFNFGKTVTDILNGIDMSGSSGGSEGAEDIGTLFNRYFKSFTYTAGEADSWTVVLNGSALLDGLQDVSVTLGADKEGVLRDFDVNTGLSMTGLSMNIKANMRYKNPCGVMDGDVEKDATTDVEGILRHGMGHKLDTVDWSTVKYLEGEYTSVKYVLAGDVLKTQYVVVSTGAEGNDPAGTLYGKLEYPSIPEKYELAGYKIEWKTAIDTLPANRTVEAVYVPLSFGLTFVSDREAEGYTFDEELGLWVIRADYRYGEAFALPFAESPVEKIVCFTDGAGNRYTSLDEWTMESTVFTAVWENVVYTATFDLGGEKTVLTGNYGDKIDFPEAQEKVGYNFVGWTVNGELVTELTLTQDVTVKAEYEPVTVRVTLVSDEAVSGFAAENGKYTKTLFLTYGAGAVELPTEMKSGVMLVAFKDEAGNLYYRVENLTQDITLYAVWEEVGYTVTFLAEDGSVVKTLNAKSGEQISTRADVPAVPYKKGYTGAWSFGSDTVTGNMTVSAVYTANEYTVTVVSSLPCAGFAETANGYEKKLRYTYGGAAVGLDVLENLSGYWFKGYYTEENGKGVALTSVSGITEDTTVYIWWQDNTVSVRLYSDLKLDGSVFDPQKNGYYVTVDFNDDYALTYAPVVEGYQQLGWWYYENGAWSPVNNVERFHGQKSVVIWAVWIQNIDVVISDFSVNKTNLGITSTMTYNIMGSFTGGSVVVGKSAEIFQKAPERSVQFVVYRENKRDGLSGGDEIVIEGNTFRKLKMTCGNSGSSWNTAPYGGARITHTFTYTDANGKSIPVTTQDEYCISLETYRYEFCNEAGEVCNTVDIRGVYGEEVRLGSFLPAVPEKEGYTGRWLVDTATVVDSGKRGTVETDGINDIVTLYTKRVSPAYTVNSYSVRLESTQAIDGWMKEGNKYVCECEAEYGSSVIFYRDNKIFSFYTVGATNNVFTLPVLDKDYVWSGAEVTKSTIKCYAQRNVDSVLYMSDVTFVYDGVSYDSYSEPIGDDYHLIVPVRAGYTFLGWYENSTGSWAKVTSLQAENGTVGVTYKLYALWMSDFSVKFNSASRNAAGVGTRKYSASVSITGGELVGAFAKEASVSTGYVFFVNQGANDTGTDNRGYVVVETVENEYASTYSFNKIQSDKKDYIHVAAQITYTYGGETFTTGEAVSSYKF